jgi:hypothetical protein
VNSASWFQVIAHKIALLQQVNLYFLVPRTYKLITFHTNSSIPCAITTMHRSSMNSLVMINVDLGRLATSDSDLNATMVLSAREQSATNTIARTHLVATSVWHLLRNINLMTKARPRCGAMASNNLFNDTIS